MPEKEIIIEIALERLRDFPGSPFSVAMDEPMKDLIGSIQTYGILNPLIVRPMPDGCYQIISGHRRKFAAANGESWHATVCEDNAVRIAYRCRFRLNQTTSR